MTVKEIIDILDGHMIYGEDLPFGQRGSHRLRQ